MTKIVRMRTVQIHTCEETDLVGALQRVQEGISSMGFELPKEVTAKDAGLDAFVEAEIAPLQREHNLMISAGSQEVQRRRVAQYLFGLAGKKATQ